MARVGQVGRAAQVGQAEVASAGAAAHLAGVTAAHTLLPVLGVPIGSSSLQGLDALLATVQMPGGIPVATVAIDNSRNAGLLAVRILATSDPALAEAMADYQEEIADMARGQSAEL